LAGRSGYQIPRGLDRALFLKLAACDWIAERRNLLLTGASSLGKVGSPARSATRRAEKTCPFSTPAPRLFADLTIAHGDVCWVRYAVGTTTILRTAVCVVFARLKSPEAV